MFPVLQVAGRGDSDHDPCRQSRWLLRALVTGVLGLSSTLGFAAPPVLSSFQKDVQPVLKEFCYDCHGDGMNKGKVAFDTLTTESDLLEHKDLWSAVLKNVRAGLMPPEKKARPSQDQVATLERWIKNEAFAINPQDLDPGRVTVRRLNRVEYRNSIKDLMGIDFNTDAEFPADDTGHGFDNIGEVLTASPMLIEKYLVAARSIVDQAVPVASRVAREHRITGGTFESSLPIAGTNEPPKKKDAQLNLSYYKPASVTNSFKAAQSGRHHLKLEVTANEKFVDGQFDLNKCRLTFRADGEVLMRQEFTRESGRAFQFEFDRDWKSGDHAFVLEMEPLTPEIKQVRNLTLRIDAVTVREPLNESHWVRPKNFERFFRREAPKDSGGREALAKELLGAFATKAFRRPVDSETVTRLTRLAQSVYSQKGKTFEAGVAQAMVAVLASPRFLFREEGVLTSSTPRRYPEVDEFSLASRLSYFLWSTMPDEALTKRAREGTLRTNLASEYRRMLADKKSEAFVKNFVGQWLQVRDVEFVPIEARSVMQREQELDPEVEKARKRFRELKEKPTEKLSAEEKVEFEKVREAFFKSFGRFNKYELDGDLRRAMRQEVEKCFDYVLREDRSLLELLESDYTFLNKRLADQYGIPGVEGDQMRRVTLPPDSPRGGVLTSGAILTVTSNPTRTSPVKRGLFILENILGTPPPPPPPNIPPLEDSAKKTGGREPTLRESLALHREAPLCSSCHNRMDPLGLALENFNALGRWRDREFKQPVDVAGRLITGESFTEIRGLKKILAHDRQLDFYRCLTEKVLTYALGRGLEYYDLETVDSLVARLSASGGKPSVLLQGIVESVPFQRTRTAGASSAPGALRASRRTENGIAK